MSKGKVLAVSLIVAAAFGSSCKNMLTGTEAAPPSAQQAPPEPVVVNGMRTSYADVVEKTSPAVVQIRMEKKEAAPRGGNIQGFPFPFPFGQNPSQGGQQPRIERGAGSGVIVAADGTILTNNHVVDGADKITVFTSDNKSYTAKIVGTDKLSDLAVIKIEAENLPFLSLGDSDKVRVGDIVLAIGNPLDIGESVTAGIISAKGRHTGLSDGSFEDFLQTDAPINRGNSGGALVNLNGELIGINSQIASEGGQGNIGIGFSIPSNMCRNVMDQLIKEGKVKRGMLGINIQNISPDIAESLGLNGTSGVLISGVKPAGAADKAGLKVKDVITAINGEKIEDPNSLRVKVASSAPGTQITVTILRDGKSQDIQATLDEFNLGPDGTDNGKKNDNGTDDSPGEGGKLGVTLEPVTPQIAKQLGLDGTNGVVVSDVDPNGPAAEAGIARGDVILEVNNKPVTGTADVKAALDAGKDKPVLLFISRRGQTSFLTVRPQ